MDAEMRIQRLLQFVDEGRIIRHEWHSCDRQGRETACLLGALGDDVDAPAKCPADVMPEWMAHVTIAIDDAGSYRVWADVVKRYGALAARWHVLDAADWRRLELDIALKALRAVWPEELDDFGMFDGLADDKIPRPNEAVGFRIMALRECGLEYQQAYDLCSMRESARDVCSGDPLGVDSLLSSAVSFMALRTGLGGLAVRDQMTELVLRQLDAAIAAKEARAA